MGIFWSYFLCFIVILWKFEVCWVVGSLLLSWSLLWMNLEVFYEVERFLVWVVIVIERMIYLERVRVLGYFL